jgi:N-methylhydantoinase B
VSWQGGGGYGDPLERETAAVVEDVERGLVSKEAARVVYGVVILDGRADEQASRALRDAIRTHRIGRAPAAGAAISGKIVGRIGDALLLVDEAGERRVVTRAGAVLARGHTAWRSGAVGTSGNQLLDAQPILLHADLAVTAYYCPISGTQLSVDFHRKDEKPVDDIVLDVYKITE